MQRDPRRHPVLRRWAWLPVLCVLAAGCIIQPKEDSGSTALAPDPDVLLLPETTAVLPTTPAASSTTARVVQPPTTPLITRPATTAPVTTSIAPPTVAVPPSTSMLTTTAPPTTAPPTTAPPTTAPPTTAPPTTAPPTTVPLSTTSPSTTAQPTLASSTSIEVTTIPATTAGGDPASPTTSDLAETIREQLTTQATTTTTRPNSAPSIDIPKRVVIDIGTIGLIQPGLSDPDGDDVSVAYEGLPESATTLADDSITFRPDAAGEWQIKATATDERGAIAITRFSLAARFELRDQLVLGMGDSVAAGNGLDLSDYLRNDSCYRAPFEGFPYRVFRSLRDAGRLGDSASARFGLPACSGHDTSEYLSRLVTAPGIDENNTRTQIDWAVELNPALILMTIGANDTEFDTPTVIAGADGRIDDAELSRRLVVMGNNFEKIMNRLVNETDSVIVLPSYHNPASQNAKGLADCTGVCFWEQGEIVVGRINQIVRAVAATHPTDRVVFVEVGPDFVGHGAPNGIFPDAIRNPGSPLGDRLSRYTASIEPYCAQDHGNYDTWINFVDCVHPNSTGHDVYANRVIEALDDRGFFPAN